MADIDRRTSLRASTAIAAGAVAPDLTLAIDSDSKTDRSLLGGRESL